MTKEFYKESFKALVLENIACDTYYIGTGNPSANILIVGKEGSCEEYSMEEICFVKQWLPKIENDESLNLKRTTWNKTEGHTWSKYQKLHDYIFDVDKNQREGFDFEERFFTTEMNTNRSKNTRSASKEGMQKRKETFFKSDFIQQFPVTVLACGDYIQNNDKIREIDDIFGVGFDKKYPNENTKNQQSFWTHYNANKTKLVIHTRQLSCNVTNELLKEMANVIKSFLGTNLI